LLNVIICWIAIVTPEATRTLHPPLSSQSPPASRCNVGIVSSAIRSGFGDNDGVRGGLGDNDGVPGGVSLLLLPKTGYSRRATWRVSGVNPSISSVGRGVRGPSESLDGVDTEWLREGGVRRKVEEVSEKDSKIFVFNDVVSSSASSLQ
jgi:hypothetical protein